MSEGADNSTVRSELRPLLPGIAFLELRVRGTNGSRAWPFLSNPLSFCLQTGSRVEDWTVELTSDHRLLFRPSKGEENSSSALIAQEIQIGEFRVAVHDLRTLPPYRLVALSDQLNFRIWPLSDGVHHLGRPGRRANAISLASPGVSRTHARFEIAGRRVHLLAEAQGALTAVNGRPIEPEQPCELRPDDLIQLGDLLFRWEREERALRGFSTPLRLRSLGDGSVTVGTDGRVEIRNENARNLLFWLASRRGEELAIERVLEGYWPERAPLRQRKNLSHTLKALQAELGWSDASLDRLLPRSADVLRLEPAAVESFDAWTLRDAARRHRQTPLGWSETLALHPAPFLASQRGGWVAVTRLELFLLWLSMLESSEPAGLTSVQKGDLAELLTRALRDGDFEEFVYERVFRLAASLGLQETIPVWMGDLSQRLLADTGDAPSSELIQRARALSRGFDRSETDRTAAARLEGPR